MDWMSPARRAALERLGSVRRNELVAAFNVRIEERRSGWPFTFSAQGRRASLGPTPTISSLFKPDWLAEHHMVQESTQERHFGRLERVPLDALWPHDRDFTDWLARPATVAVLAEALSIELAPSTNTRPDSSADMAAILIDPASGRTVVAGGSPTSSARHPLVGLLAAAAAVDARTVVWVASHFTSDQRRSLAWLDSVTGPDTRFHALTLEMWSIDGSPPAPHFTPV